MFALFGPLTVLGEAGAHTTVAGERVRALLAALLLCANTPVSIDGLAEWVWDGTPPPGYPATLRSHLRRLRRALGPQAAARISACDPGYVIRLDESDLDVLMFEASCRQAGAALSEGAWHEASDAARRGLALWRAQPLLDVTSQTLRDQFLPGLDQQRLLLLERRAEADLRLGRHDHLVPQLRELAARHPLRERFHAQLMLALAFSGRQAEALAAYRRARRALIDDLGVEPGFELRDLHKRILAGDAELLPSLTRPSETGRAGGSSRLTHPPEIPRQLPAAVPHFAGRERELKVLSELLSLDAARSGAVVIAAIGGAAGIGKTALAVHWAHLHADQFPDGQLYVNLRGFDPSGVPAPPAAAIRRFLTALGVPPRGIPSDPEEQTALYRTQLADRRMLILLDNARDVEQVRPLLPGAPGNLVLVTSRDQLAELVALDGAVPLVLDPLTDGDAHELLNRRLGSARLAAEEKAIDELIRACARLPLALNIAAARATLQPAHSLLELADGLQDAHRRLDTLDLAGTANARAVYSWSYRVLRPEAARMFRLLGVHQGSDISREAAASLADLDPDHTRAILDELTRAHLITEHVPGRYTFHDLLRAYAAEQARVRDSETERREAQRRVRDFYLHTALAADRLLHPHRPVPRLDPPAPGSRFQRPNDMTAALAWFDAEHSNLLAAQRTAAHARHPAAWQLAWTLSTFHIRRGHRHDELAVWQLAVEAATATRQADPAAQSLVHRFLGRAYADLGRHERAIEHLHQALAAAELHQDDAEQAHTHRTLAWAWERGGDLHRELHHAQRALDLYRAVEQSVWEADALHMVGWCAARLGRFAIARSDCHAALALHREHCHVTGEADTLNSLGYVEHHTGHQQQAIDFYRRALTLRQALGNTYQSADTLDEIGHPLVSSGQHELARAAWRQALDLYRRQGRTQDAERVQHQLDVLDRTDCG